MAKDDGELALGILRAVAGDWGITQLNETKYIINDVLEVNPAQADLLRRLNDKYA